tara:strand:+ start:195 stop:1172 length:978 start_codon:yes stop_codon:yes gene_type:complete
MILKHYNLTENIIKINNIFLLYGNNEGLKNEAIDKIVKGNQFLRYDENEVLNNENLFYESATSSSLFENNKIIIVKRATDKILKIIQEIFNKNNKETCIILNANALEKKSKLRSFFEKEKKVICLAFYPDNDQTLSKLAYNFFSKKKIIISQENINLIISKCNGDRSSLLNELIKIENFAVEGRKISTKDIAKLININENHSVSELIDNCLTKNKKKIIIILNENNFSNEDCILITRTFLIKSKKILGLLQQYEINKDIDLTISSARPPIFWKDKKIVMQQIYNWSPKSISALIYRLNELELNIKKNINNSIHLVCDFILEQSST